MDFRMHFGPAREKYLAVDYLDNFGFHLVLYLVLLVLRLGTRTDLNYWLKEVNSILTQIRQVDADSPSIGVKVKGNEQISRDEYLFWLLRLPDLLVSDALEHIRHFFGPDMPTVTAEELTGIVVSLGGECVDLMMSTLYPNEISAKPVIAKYRKDFLRLRKGTAKVGK